MPTTARRLLLSGRPVSPRSNCSSVSRSKLNIATAVGQTQRGGLPFCADWQYGLRLRSCRAGTCFTEGGRAPHADPPSLEGWQSVAVGNAHGEWPMCHGLDPVGVILRRREKRPTPAGSILFDGMPPSGGGAALALGYERSALQAGRKATGGMSRDRLQLPQVVPTPSSASCGCGAGLSKGASCRRGHRQHSAER